MRYTHLLLMLLWGIGFANGQGNPLLRNYTPKEYDNTAQIWCALQDEQGLLYFGATGGEGIMQYDGVEWRKIPVANGTTVFSLVLASDKQIYAGCKGDFGRLVRGAKGEMTFESLAGLIPQKGFKFSSVWSARAEGNFVYFQCYEAIFVYDIANNTVKTYRTPAGERLFGAFLHEGNCYTVTNKQGLLLLGKDTLLAVPNNDPIKGSVARNAYLVGKDSLLLPTDNKGVYLFQPAKQAISPFVTDDRGYFSSKDLYSSARLFDGLIGFGSKTQGLLMLKPDGNYVATVGEKHGLQDPKVYNLISDKDRNIWLTLSAGITKVDGNFDISYFGKNEGIRGSVINVFPSTEQGLLVATSQSVFQLQPDGTFKEIEGLPATQYWHLSEFQHFGKRLLLLGGANGIYRIESGKATLIQSGSHVHHIEQSKFFDNTYYYADGLELKAMVFSNEKAFKVRTLKGVKDDIRSILENEDGSLWLGTYYAGPIRASLVDDTTVVYKQYKEADGLPNLISISPMKINGRLIFGSSKGFYTLNPQTDKFEPYCGFGNEFCKLPKELGGGALSIIEGKDNALWVFPGKNKGEDIILLQPDGKGGYEKSYRSLRRIPEMEMEGGSAYVQDKNGILWIGGNEGLFRYDPSLDREDYERPFNTLIRRVMLGDDSIVYHGNASDPSSLSLHGIDYWMHNIRFEFAGLSFDDESRTQYSHYLEGYDAHWSEWSKSNFKEYTNLREGEYVFKVKARNLYGAESEVATYRFSILPPWYRSWWAYSAYILAAGLFVWLVVKWNTRRLMLDKERLEETVAQRTAEITQKKEEILAQAENLKQLNEEITLQADGLRKANEEIQKQKQEVEEAADVIQHKNELITSSIRYAQTIQNAFVPPPQSIRDCFADAFVVFQARDIVSGDFYWHEYVDVNGTTMHFLAAADCTGHGVPGAFMSLVGYNLLKEIVRLQHVYEPKEILERLDKGVRTALHQENKSNDDGMDVCLCRIMKLPSGQWEVVFAGAKRPLYVVRSEQFMSVKGTNRSIGGIQLKMRDFEQDAMLLSSGDWIFLSTDGFGDQHNEQREKLSTARLISLLESNWQLPSSEQRDIILNTFNTFRGTEEQRDDMTVLGIRL